MLRYALLFVFLMASWQPHAAMAEDASTPLADDELVKQNDGAWQNIQDFEATRYFAIAGPPTREDAERAKAETQLYEDMVDNFDNLEDGDDDYEYQFVVESLFGPEESRPASLRSDEDSDQALNEEADSPMSTSEYIDSVRPTFLPGMQIKPRAPEPEKKENADARSLFADILKPKADEILGEEIKPVIAVDSAKQAAEEAAKAENKGEKAGRINAPPKQRAVSPDEETLNQLKQAVKQLGLEKRLNLGSGSDGHQTLETNTEPPTQANNAPATAPKAASPKPPTPTAKRYDGAKKKALKPKRRARAKPKAPEAEPAPPPKEESIFDLF